MKNIILFIFMLLFSSCNNTMGTSSEKNMVGKWKLTIGEKAYETPSTIIILYKDNSCVSINTFDKSGKKQQETKKGIYKVERNKLIISEENDISKEVIWIFKNSDLLEYKTNKQNDPDGFFQSASFYLKKISDETDGDSK